MKHVLVTGGAGFIGSNLALEIQRRFPAAEVTVVDDFRGSSFKNLIGFKGDVLAFNVAEVKSGDSPHRGLSPLFENRPLDVIFHLASITDTTLLDEKKMMFDNVEGFRNVLVLALEKKAEVVYASSAAVYGSGARLPDGQAVPGGAAGGGSQETPMKEEDAGKPNNVYGFSKWTMDQLARTYEGRLKLVGLRYFNVFGPGEWFKGAAASMIYQLAKQMMSGKRPRIFKWGEQRRDFIYVKDAVAATLRAREAKRNTVLNVGTGKSTSFNEVIEALNEGLGTRLEPDYFDNPYSFYQDFTQADMSHTKREIGFEPQFSTREGILDYVRNFLLPTQQGQPV